MLLDSIKRIFRWGYRTRDPDVQNKSFEHANAFQLAGDYRTAITEYSAHLERFPHDVDALNNLGCCLDFVGNMQSAAAVFEKAFMLDDSNLAVIVNYAHALVDKHKINEGLQYLIQAKAYDPDNPNVHTVYSRLLQNKGDAETSSRYALKAWLSAFDNLRMANTFLFHSAYTDISEARLAAEHRFWAETLLPVPTNAEETVPPSFATPPKSTKIRIGYWSPDFRNHSVHFFALPLMENHDREKFEIIAYHDAPFHDSQTEAIKSSCDYFMPVSDVTDAALIRIIRSHQLDILVELAGHTSANRLNLLQVRLATRQLTGIGYPATTGLSTMDGKFLDKHVINPDSTHYYTEPAFSLGDSFWCFDPKDSPEINPIPPVARNGYITFGCVGNIAKITQSILKCWARILNEVPSSRLLIRSISLTADEARQHISHRLSQSGIDLKQVELLGPARGTDFLTSYNDIDIILDTFPFNGGTTSCFATYMGVPIISVAGQSLLSGMGKSTLSNLGLTDCIASSLDEYIEKAIRHAKNINFLYQFRSKARAIYETTPLGNGQLFARNFEQQCVALLSQTTPPPPHQVDALPVGEIVTRAYATFRYGQFDAGKRIVDYCLKAYPDCGAAHVLSTFDLIDNKQFTEAAEYLEARLEGFSAKDKFTALVNIARFNILASRNDKAAYAIDQAQQYAQEDIVSDLQLKLLQAHTRALTCINNKRPSISNRTPHHLKSIAILIVCDQDDEYEELKNRFQDICHAPDNIAVAYYQCAENNRWKSYLDHLNSKNEDIMVIVQKNIGIYNANLFSDILNTLADNDIVGIGGASSWDRIEWRHGPMGTKSMCYLTPSGEMDGYYEINFASHIRISQINNLAVLDGNFLACKKHKLRSLDPYTLLDPLLEGAGTLLEEHMTHAAYRHNLSLTANLNLGIIVDWRKSLKYDHIGEARWQIAQQLKIDPFFDEAEDRSTISLPVTSPDLAVQILAYFFNDVHDAS